MCMTICYIYNCITRSIKIYKGHIYKKYIHKGNSFNNNYTNDVGENKAS